MPNFTCDACGHQYSDRGNYTSCPNCAGLGKKDPKCTCLHFSSLGGPLNIIAKGDANCPIHGASKAKKAKA